MGFQPTVKLSRVKPVSFRSPHVVLGHQQGCTVKDEDIGWYRGVHQKS